MTEAQAQLAVAMCEEDPCFCGTTDETHSEACDSLQTELIAKRPKDVVVELLESRATENQQIGEGEAQRNGEQQDQRSVEQQNETCPEQQNRKIVEDATQQTREQQDQQSGVGQNRRASEEINNGNNQRTTSSPPSAQSSTKSIWARLLLPDMDKNAALVEALLALLEFLTLEHVAMQYVTRISCDQTIMDASHIPQFGNGGQGLLSMTSPSINLHKKVIQCLRQYSCCDKHGDQSSEVPWEDCSCVIEVNKWAPLLQDGNPLLETFSIQLTKLRIPGINSPDSQINEFLNCLCKLIDLHMAMALTYLRKLEMKMSEPSKDFWKKCDFKEVVTTERDVDEEFRWYETGMCFPGRSCCRPGITFEVKESQHCNKKYPKSETHSLGLLTVQCACENPKLIGFIVMTRAESTALTLSAILMYFPIPPRTVYYDNACNLFASIFLRLPWLLNCTRVAVDRFHYKSHTCSAFFCPDSYQVLDNERTETAESFNARIDKSLYHMRHLGADNLIPFLYNRLGQLNVAALFKERFHRQDLDDEDLSSFLRSEYKCVCPLCTATTAQIGESLNFSTESGPTHNGEQDVKQGNSANEGSDADEGSTAEENNAEKESNDEDGKNIVLGNSEEEKKNAKDVKIAERSKKSGSSQRSDGIHVGDRVGEKQRGGKQRC